MKQLDTFKSWKKLRKAKMDDTKIETQWFSAKTQWFSGKCSFSEKEHFPSNIQTWCNKHFELESRNVFFSAHAYRGEFPLHTAVNDAAFPI